MPDADRYRIRAVTRMVAVLDAFTPQAPELGVAELAEFLGLPKTTVHRFLVNLEAGGLLERVPRTGRYRLGLRLLELGGVVVGQMSLFDEAPPLLRRLADASGAAAYLAVPEGTATLYMEAAGRGGPMVPVGARRAPEDSALGRALLAWRPAEELAERVGEAVLTELAGVRARGFAVHDRDGGVRGLAAPVRDHTGQVIAAVGFEGPAATLVPERVIGLAPVLLEASRALSRRLGAHRARDLGPRPRRVVASRGPNGHGRHAANGSGAVAHGVRAPAAAR